MNKPTEAQINEFWWWCKPKHYPQYREGKRIWPRLDLNNLFKYAPDIIVGVTFRYYPGGCECELTYMTEAGFETEKSWVKNETGDERKSKELSALTLFWAIWEVITANKVSC